MEHRDILLTQILNTAPNQLPPIIHSGGTYLLDVSYLGFKVHHVGISLEECLHRYYCFVLGVNKQVNRKKDPLVDAPVKPGSPVGKRASQS
jgi:hypothetical protein